MRGVLISIALLSLSAGCQSGISRVNLTDLHGSIEPLRARFNAGGNKPRVIAFFSPV